MWSKGVKRMGDGLIVPIDLHSTVPNGQSVAEIAHPDVILDRLFFGLFNSDLQMVIQRVLLHLAVELSSRHFLVEKRKLRIILLSNTPAVASVERSSSFGSVLRGCSTSVFSVACAVSDWSGASLLPEEETGTGCSAICEVLLHPEVKHKRTIRKRTAILDFISLCNRTARLILVDAYALGSNLCGFHCHRNGGTVYLNNAPKVLSQCVGSAFCEVGAVIYDIQ